MKMKLTLLVLATSSFNLSASAENDLSPGYLPEFQYQVSDVSSNLAQRIMDAQLTETRGRSICANRALVWNYQTHRRFQRVQMGKVFIHFTSLGQANENKEWAYHVAPYLLVDGQEMVLESGFSNFNGKPSKLSDWTHHFGKSKRCVVLDPTQNPKHLELEKFNLPNHQITPLTFQSGSARQYPIDEGVCYIRKVPAYYAYPADVYGVDLYLAGNSDYKKFYKTDFAPKEVFAACRQATSLKWKLENTCEDFLGISRESLRD